MTQKLIGKTLSETLAYIENFQKMMRGDMPFGGKEMGDLKALEGVPQIPRPRQMRHPPLAHRPPRHLGTDFEEDELITEAWWDLTRLDSKRHFSVEHTTSETACNHLNISE